MKVMRLSANNKKLISFILVLTVLISSLSGCGKNSKRYEEPELLAPYKVTKIFKKPERRDIKKVSYAEGVVVPTDYPAYYSNMTKIDKVCVKVGDYVEKGDVIAIGNSSMTDESIDMLNMMSSSYSSMNNIQQRINNFMLEIEDYNRKEAEENGDDDGINQAVKNISLINEDIRYGDEITNYRVSSNNKKIDDITNDVGESTLVADHSGYITFIKDISSNDTAMAYENVAIISDMDDLYIECRDLTLTNYKVEDYTEKYTYLGGKKVNVKERNYSPKIRSLASVERVPLNMRFDVDSGNLNVGDDMLIIFKKTVREDVLTVSVGALESEGNNRFVYVKKNEDDVERRDVEVGYKNGSYIEIKYGLTEDDEVYYALDNYMPVVYKEEEVVPGVIDVGEKSQFMLPKNSNIQGYYSEFACQLTDIFVKPGDTVNEGDILFTYQTEYTAAKLSEVQQNIITLQKNHNDTLEMFYKMRKQIEEGANPDEPEAEEPAAPTKIGTASWTDAIKASPSDADLYDYEYFVHDIKLAEEQERLSMMSMMPMMPMFEPKYVEEKKNLNLAIIDCRIEMENILFQSQYDSLSKEYERISKNNDGYGLISVYAENKGKVKYIDKDAVPGKAFKFRHYILAVSEEGYNECLVQMRELKKGMNEPASPEIGKHKPADLGKNVTIKLDEKIYNVKCIGTNGNIKPKYISEKDDKPAFTFCTPGSEYPDQFYVEMPQDLDYETALSDKYSLSVTFNSKDYKDVPVLDKGVIYTDYVDDAVYPYVWVENDGELDKRYVTCVSIDGYKGSDVIIIDGLELGDKVIRETTGVVEDN